MTIDKSAPENTAELVHALWRKQIHKLNNSLAAIIGHTTLLSYDIPEGEGSHGFIRNIREATREAIHASDILGELEECIRSSQLSSLLQTLPPQKAEQALELLTKTTAKISPVEISPPRFEDFQEQHGIEKILLVEDDDQLRALLIECLRDLGYELEIAVDGREAKERFREKQDEFDLICIDFHLPYATGLEVAQFIRKYQPRIRMILLSGSPVDPNDPAVQAIGFSRILAKPLEITDFARILRQALDEDSPIQRS